jgi:hypothetical protein
MHQMTDLVEKRNKIIEGEAVDDVDDDEDSDECSDLDGKLFLTCVSVCLFEWFCCLHILC